MKETAKPFFFYTEPFLKPHFMLIQAIARKNTNIVWRPIMKYFLKNRSRPRDGDVTRWSVSGFFARGAGCYFDIVKTEGLWLEWVHLWLEGMGRLGSFPPYKYIKFIFNLFFLDFLFIFSFQSWACVIIHLCK